MQVEIISKRTIEVFFDLLSDRSVVNEICQLFENEGVFRKPNHSSSYSGARKATADGYVSNLDMTKQSDAYRLIKVIETFLIRNDNEYSNIQEDSRFIQLLKLLNNDGFDYVDGRIIPISGILVNQTELIDSYGLEFVKRDWERAINQCNIDPEDAITAARSMLESTCKWILDKLSITYTERDDLPQLYKKVADRLVYFPDRNGERIFKQISGSMSGIVSHMSELRNKYGDSHGKNENYIPPTKTHSVLAVNLSGALCTFLIETYMSNINEGNNLS